MDLEDQLINRIKNKYIGDDGAIIDNYIYSMDAFWEGTHFKKGWMSIEQIVYKAFIVNFSDMIAMNAKPKYMLITIAIPKDFTKDKVDRLTKKFKQISKEYQIDIIGGDTIGSDRLGIVITMIGTSNNPLRRDTLNSGDFLAYTGNLGSVKRDLEMLFDGERIPDNSKFYNPKIRVDFIRAATPWLTAGMDISDGLYCDTNKLLKLNNLYPLQLIPITPDIGFSGEEYEMLIAFKPENLERIKKIAKVTKTPITIFAKASSIKHEYYPCKSHHF